MTVRRLFLAVLSWSLLVTSAMAQPEVPAAVRDEIERSGRALVIVGVRIPVFDAEGDLTPTAVAAQRASIRLAVESVLDSVESGVTVGHRYESIPYFSAAIDANALAALARMPDVVSIHEDVPVPPSLAQSVPLIGGDAARAAGATGAGWTVAVLDTGVQTNHPLLAGRTITESCFSNAGGAAGGTSLCPGGADSSVAAGSGINCTGISGCDHGTHVAGISVGGGALNGVAPGAFLMASQVFTRVDNPTTCGGASSTPCILSYGSDRIATLQRILALAGPANANRIASVNMSLGGGRFFSNCDTGSNAAEKAAIDNLRSIGIATVIASGNDGFSDSMGSPGCISSAISVGSTTKTDTVSSFSNVAPFMSLYAPGSSITSAVINSATGVKSGTSMATPHVAGAWAVLKQANPNATVDQVLAALRNTGTPIARPGTAAFPRINVNAARLALTGGGGGTGAPGRAGRPSVTVSGGLIVINWTAPPSGGTPTNYRIRAGTTSGGAQLGVFDLGNLLSIGPVFLPNGAYFIAVTATNSAGAGQESEERDFTVGPSPVPPGQPNLTQPTVVGNNVTISWSQGSGGAPDFYLLTLSSFGTFNVGPLTSVSGSLPAGTYTVTVTAVNVFGQATSVSRTFTIAGPAAPGVPNLNQPTVSGNTVTITWSPGSGGTPDVYDIEAVIQATGQMVPLTVPGSQTSMSIPGVPAGNFLVRIRARNGIAASDFSPQRIIVVGITLISGDVQVTLTWNSTSDMDLHVREPNGTHVFYANRNGTTARLDVDDTNGFGPENIYVTQGQAAAGIYQFYIVHFSGPPTTATIAVRLRPGTANERSAIFVRTTNTANTGLGINVANVDIQNGIIAETTGTRVAELPGQAAAPAKVPEEKQEQQ